MMSLDRARNVLEVENHLDVVTIRRNYTRLSRKANGKNRRKQRKELVVAREVLLDNILALYGNRIFFVKTIPFTKMTFNGVCHKKKYMSDIIIIEFDLSTYKEEPCHPVISLEMGNRIKEKLVF